MKNRQFLFLLIMLFIFSSSHRGKDKDPVNKNVVLRVANVSITEYELEKNLQKFKDAYYDTTNVQASPLEIKQWLDDFIGRAYFLADAYAEEYDKRKEVAQGVIGMEKLMISQPKGVLELSLIDKNLDLEEKEIKLAQERSKKKITLEYLKFDNFDSAMHHTAGNQLRSLEEFNKAIENSISHKSVIHNEEVISWPLIHFWEYDDYLFNMKKGEITPILKFPHGFYVFYIKEIETSSEGLSDDEVIQKLKLLKEEKIIVEHRKEINDSINSTTVNYNLEALNKFEEILSAVLPLHELQENYFKDILSERAFTFLLGKEKIQYSIADLIDYYNYLPIKQEIRDPKYIGQLIRSLIYSEYSYMKAETLGITTDTEFVLDRENYRKNLIYHYYELDKLKPFVKISEDEISHWYYTKKGNYVQPVGVNISIFYFDNMANAAKALMEIDKNRGDKSKLTQLNGLQNMEWDINIAYQDSEFPSGLRKRLLFMENNQLLPTSELGKSYSVIIKNYDYGQRTRDLGEVKEEVISIIEATKLLAIKKEHLQLLKKKYACSNRINYEKYF